MFVRDALVVFGFLVAADGLAHAQDVARGKAVFNQCMACHQLENNMVGPMLKGVVGRKAASAAGFSTYSPIMKMAGEAGLTWTEADLVAYLKNPTDYLTTYDKEKGMDPSGPSRMLFKLANEQQRKDVVAYLASVK